MQRTKIEQLYFNPEETGKEMKIRKKGIIIEDQRMGCQLMDLQSTKRKGK